MSDSPEAKDSLMRANEKEIAKKPIIDIHDGSYVTCGVCGRQSKVKIFKPGQVALIGPDAMRSMKRENIALKCQECGFIICFSCASSQMGPVGISTCPSCKKEGGPYFFTTRLPSLEAKASPLSVSSSDFPQVVLTSPKPAVVDFWAAWCGPCRTMRPVFERLSAEFSGRALFASLNIDDSPEVAASFGVLGIPTFIVFVGGKPVERIVGACGEEALRKAVEKHLAPI